MSNFTSTHTNPCPHSIPGCLCLFRSMGQFKGLGIEICGNTAVIHGRTSRPLELELLKNLFEDYKIDSSHVQIL